MKILIVYRYFWPDTPPYARTLRTLAERWIKDGHQVTVFTSQPSYNDIKTIPKQPQKETVNGVRVIRLSLLPEKKSNMAVRLINSLWFMFRSIMHTVFCGHYDLITTATIPPVLMGFTVRKAAQLSGSYYLYHCQDIYPEAGLYSGLFKQNWLYHFLLRVDCKTCKNAAAVIMLSQDMANTLKSRGLNDKNFHIINNFNLQEFGKPQPMPVELAKPHQSFRVLFAGNIGNFQGLDTVMETAQILKGNPGIQFVFLGEGAAKVRLQEQASEMLGKTVFFFPYQPMEIAFQVMEQADLGLVTLTPNIYKVAYPSKTMMLLAAGCPLLVMVEPESELTQFVNEQEVGVSCPLGDSTKMAEQIQKWHDDVKQSPIDRTRIKRIGLETFGRDNVMERWSKLILDLERRLASAK